MKWAVPKMWQGETVAILASGPSMSQEVADEVMRRAVRTIAINTTYQLAPWADLLYAADHAWWERYWKTASKFHGLKVSIGPDQRSELHYLHNSGQHGFDPDPANLRVGGFSGYQAVHLAVHAGVKRIDLYGFDMRSVGNSHHWHGVHPSPLRNHGESIYKRWIDAVKTLQPELTKREIEVINQTPGSALKCFPFHAEPKQMAA